LITFAARAYRRPLSLAEAGDLRGLYRRFARTRAAAQEAFELTLARVFVGLALSVPARSHAVRSRQRCHLRLGARHRLSYFLWSSQPDEELRTAAATGTLHQPEVLTRQARRMLKDERTRRLATEFACQWLHIHDFASIEEKARNTFPKFADLRGDMYEESSVLQDLFRRDASLLKSSERRSHLPE